MVRSTLVALSILASTGCVSAAGIDAGNSKSFTRSGINGAKRSCMFAASCTTLGIMLLHADTPYKRKTWTEPIDKDAAKLAFDRGCALGEGQACASLVEFDLVSSPADRERVKRRAYFFGAKIRTPEEVAAMDRRDTEKAAQEDSAHEADLAKQQAEINAASGLSASAIENTAIEGYAAYKQANDQVSTLKSDMNTLQNRNARITDRVNAGADAANRTSELLTGAPLIDPNTLPKICIPCESQLSTTRSACTAPVKAEACAQAAKALAVCMEATPCGN